MRMAGLVVLCGCSFFAVRSPAPDRPCTTSYTPPVVDTIATAVFGGLTAAAAWAAFHSTGGLDTAADNVAWIAAAVPTTVFAVSGVIGYVKVTSCRDSSNGATAATSPDGRPALAR